MLLFMHLQEQSGLTVLDGLHDICENPHDFSSEDGWYYSMRWDATSAQFRWEPLQPSRLGEQGEG